MCKNERIKSVIESARRSYNFKLQKANNMRTLNEKNEKNKYFIHICIALHKFLRMFSNHPTYNFFYEKIVFSREKKNCFRCNDDDVGRQSNSYQQTMHNIKYERREKQQQNRSARSRQPDKKTLLYIWNVLKPV